MAVRKKSKPDVEKKVEFITDRRITVSVGTSADYGKAKVGLALSQNVKEDDDAMELADSIFDELTEKLEDQFDKLADKVGLDEDPGEESEDDWDGEDEDPDDEDPDDEDGEWDDEDEEAEDISPDDIKKMKKAELLELIKDEDLDVSPKEFKKIADLREAIIDELFESEEDDEDADDDEDPDWDDDEWDDD